MFANALAPGSHILWALADGHDIVGESNEGNNSASTPMALGAPPTGTPVGSQTVTFDDRAGPSQALDGQYPTGVVDWGAGQWWHSGPFGQFTTKSTSLTRGATSRTFTFVTPRRLVSVQSFNGGDAPTTITLACPGQPTNATSLAAGQLATITTGWTGTCSTVGVSISNGWDTNFDNLVHDGG